MERDLSVDLEIGDEAVESIIYIATCETCGWEGTQTEDKNEAIMEEWQHIRKYSIGVEHKVKLHGYLIFTQIIELEDV